MMNPADQHSPTAAQRAAEPPTLWLSLALGSILIHLVLFILASIVSTQTAKVQLDIEPIAVEFVDPQAARSAVPGEAIAVRPAPPSSAQPSSTPIQPRVPPRSSSFNQPIEQPLLSPQPVKTVPPRQPQRDPIREPVLPQPQPSSRRSQPQPAPSSKSPQGNLPSASSQGGTPGTSSQGGLPGTSSGNGMQQPSDSQQPATSAVRIAEPPQGGDVSVEVLKSYEIGDFHAKKASIQSPIKRSIRYSPLITQALKQGLTVKVSLDIDQNGFSQIIETSPGSEGNTVDQATLNDLAEQIFKDQQFEPAQHDPGGLSVKPRRSNLIIEARIRLL